jgi:hypothetical protein
MGSPEAEVVYSLKQHLQQGGLAGVSPSRLLVDADPSYMHSRRAKALEPMARVDIEGAYPDLLCCSDRSASSLITGFEVKASSVDWLKGLAQARRYRSGVHHSYLALPGRAKELERDAGRMARDMGVGVLVLEGEKWHEIVQPIDPIPLPWSLGSTAAALDGVPLARQLQLNHPLNYLVVPFLAACLPPGRSLGEELESRWPDLGRKGTRQHAIAGAKTLRLLDAQLQPTIEGGAVADLLQAVGFSPESRPSKRLRLVEVAPALAAIARFVLVQQPAVRLIRRVLHDAGGSALMPALATAAAKIEPVLAAALFLADPSSEFALSMAGRDYNPSTVFKLKQNLWHAGILSTGKHASAGGRAAEYRPADDVWAL